jgi:hypothetical protein
MLRGLRQDVGAGNDYVVELTGWDCKTGRPTQGSAQNCGLDAGSAIKRDDLGGESLTQGMFFCQAQRQIQTSGTLTGLRQTISSAT